VTPASRVRACVDARAIAHACPLPPSLTSFYDRNEILMRRRAARRANEATSSAMLLESLINGRKLRLRHFLCIVKSCGAGCRLAVTSADSSKNADRYAASREFTLRIFYSSTVSARVSLFLPRRLPFYRSHGEHVS